MWKGATQAMHINKTSTVTRGVYSDTFEKLLGFLISGMNSAVLQSFENLLNKTLICANAATPRRRVSPMKGPHGLP